MTDLADMRERHQRVLAELTELGLAFARDARIDAEAAETPEARAQQALVFQRVSRSIRQSLALEARLFRDGDLAAREAQARADRQDRDRVSARKRQLEAAVHGLAWREFEADEDDREDPEDAGLYGRFLDAIDDEAARDDLLTADLTDQVVRVLAAIGFEIGVEGQLRPTPTIQSSA